MQEPTDKPDKQSIGDAAHCARVAAYCEEIAQQTGLSSTVATALRQSALLHHDEERRNAPFVRELTNLGIFANRDDGDEAANQSISDQILASYFDPGAAAEGDIRLLTHILEMADLFDETFEFGAFSDQRLSEIFNPSQAGQLHEPVVPFVLSYLRGCSMDELRTLIPRIPVFPPVALELLTISRNSDVPAEQFVRLASVDQVLAGTLLSVANSAAHGRGANIQSVQRAVLHLGTDLTRQVLLAAAIRPILNCHAQPDLWLHSIESAETADAIARLTGMVDPADAYTLGLLHDVGRLLLELVPSNVRQRRARLEQAGCAPTVAELVTCGATHAEAGAEVLRMWNLPHQFATAVSYHHEPEHCESKLAALLYLMEYWISSEEDLPSAARLHCALTRLNLTMTDLKALPARRPSSESSS
jgi:putative nucleotidyltransferase with HDIG domain